MTVFKIVEGWFSPEIVSFLANTETSKMTRCWLPSSPPSPQYLHGKCSFPFISGENIWKGRFGPVLLPSYNNPFPIQLELRILFFPVKILFFSHAHCLLYWLLLHTISFSGEFSLRYKATTFIVVIFDYISLLFIISMIKWNNDNNFDAKLSFSDAIFFFFLN